MGQCQCPVRQLLSSTNNFSQRASLVVEIRYLTYSDHENVSVRLGVCARALISRLEITDFGLNRYNPDALKPSLFFSFHGGKV